MRVGGESVVAVVAMVASLALLWDGQRHDIEWLALWLSRVLFALAVIFEHRPLFHRETLSFVSTKGALTVVGVGFLCLCMMWKVPILFMDLVALPILLGGAHIYHSLFRTERELHLHSVDSWLSTSTMLALFDCFNFLKIGSLLGLAAYHLLTSSTPSVADAIGACWTASSLSVFPHSPMGNHQRMLDRKSVV